MSKNSGGSKKGKKTLGSMIITVLATIIVIVASLLGFGGDDVENATGTIANNTADTEVVSEADENTDVGQSEDADVGEVSESDELKEDIKEEASQAEEDSNETVVEEQESEVVSEEPLSEPEQEDISETTEEPEDVWANVTVAEITFRSQKLLDQHYDKHGIEMGFASAEEYELAAYKVTIHPDTLHKIEAEDGDDVFYREETNEFVVVSQDGYIRTYFNPNAGIDYYNRQ